MVKLTVELIARTGAAELQSNVDGIVDIHACHIDPFLNPLKDRELDLRGALTYRCTR